MKSITAGPTEGECTSWRKSAASLHKFMPDREYIGYETNKIIPNACLGVKLRLELQILA